MDSFKDGTLTVTSRRYPFCATGDAGKDNSIRAAMGTVGAIQPGSQPADTRRERRSGGRLQSHLGRHDQDLHCQPTRVWSQVAADFAVNPFSETFAKVDDAVAKQAYETRQVKMLFHGDEGKVDMPGTVELTERVRKKFADALPVPLPPVAHTIRIEPQ